MEISDWTKKYEPKTLSDMVLTKRVAKVVSAWLDKKDIENNILLSGTPGFGKTSLAQVLRKNINIEDSIYINAGDIVLEDLRKDLKQFLMKPNSDNLKKIIVFDEFDLVPSKAQDYLKSLIYQYQHKAVFIGTTNNKHLLPEATLSRFHSQISLVPEDEKEQDEHILEFTKRAIKILQAENVEFDKKVVYNVVKSNYPDFRKTLTVLQMAKNQFNKIDENILKVSLGINRKLIDAMKTKNLEEVIKQIKYINCSNFFSDFFSYMQLQLEPESWPGVIFTLGEYNGKACFDKELNIVACISKLINSVDLKWKKKNE